MLLILSIFRILYIRHRQVLDLAKLTLHFVQTRSPSGRCSGVRVSLSTNECVTLLVRAQ